MCFQVRLKCVIGKTFQRFSQRLRNGGVLFQQTPSGAYERLRLKQHALQVSISRMRSSTLAGRHSPAANSFRAAAMSLATRPRPCLASRRRTMDKSASCSSAESFSTASRTSSNAIMCGIGVPRYSWLNATKFSPFRKLPSMDECKSARYPFTRSNSRSVLPVPEAPENSFGRSFPTGATQLFKVSPSIS